MYCEIKQAKQPYECESWLHERPDSEVLSDVSSEYEYVLEGNPQRLAWSEKKGGLCFIW